MASDRATLEFILERLRSPRFCAQAMFGEFAIYADGKVVGLISDNRFFVKIHPATSSLEAQCEKLSAYPGSKPYYLVEEGQLTSMQELPGTLLKLADALPEPETKPEKAKPKKGKAKR